MPIAPVNKCNRKFLSGVVEFKEGGEQENFRNDVVSALQNIIDPNSGTDIVEAGLVGEIFVQNNNVEISLLIDKTSVSIADEIKKLCMLEMSMLEWVSDIDVQLKNREAVETATSDAVAEETNGMAGVKNIIAVSSCKGGVGKSTVSVNLAYTLSQGGAKVGILDADIYGPSLPTMTQPLLRDRMYEDNKLIPLEYEGVKLLSLGFINQGAAIMRGPMVNQILNQFVLMSSWGDLDYLIIDMPPGTGDIQLTLSQIMNITAAVIVTTPQKLSFVDVVKGIDMFDTVNVPAVAVVENMAEYSTYSFTDDFYSTLAAKIGVVVTSATESTIAAAAATNTTTTTTNDAAVAIASTIKEAVEAQRQPRKVFGVGHNRKLEEMWGINNIVSLPLLDEVAASGDSGRPYVLSHPESKLAAQMKALASSLTSELENLAKSTASGPTLTFDASTGMMEYRSKKLSSFDLRCDCRCAVCVEELTGEALLDKSQVSRTVRPLGTAPIGKYAISVDWSDGHKSLYPFRQIERLAETLASA